MYDKMSHVILSCARPTRTIVKCARPTRTIVKCVLKTFLGWGIFYKQFFWFCHFVRWGLGWGQSPCPTFGVLTTCHSTPCIVAFLLMLIV